MATLMVAQKFMIENCDCLGDSGLWDYCASCAGDKCACSAFEGPPIVLKMIDSSIDNFKFPINATVPESGCSTERASVPVSPMALCVLCGKEGDSSPWAQGQTPQDSTFNHPSGQAILGSDSAAPFPISFPSSFWISFVLSLVLVILHFPIYLGLSPPNSLLYFFPPTSTSPCDPKTWTKSIKNQ